MTISPILNQYISQPNNLKPANAPTDSNASQVAPNSQVQADTFESSNKKINKKQITKIGAAIAMVAGCVALIKCGKTNKLKREVTELYNSIYESILKETQANDLNFEKPELVFKKLQGSAGCYNPNENKLFLNSDYFKRNKGLIKKDLAKSEACVENGKFKLDTIFGISATKNADEMYRIATQEEKIALMGKTLYHELTHAKQFQYALSTQGGKEKLIEGFRKKAPNLSDKEFKKLYSFVFNYKPNKLFDNNITFIEPTQEGMKYSGLQYKLDSIVNAFTNYDSNNLGNYYLNLAEISARNGEAKYFDKLLKGELKKPQNLSDETIKNLYEISKKQVDVLLEAKEQVLRNNF